MESYYDTDLKKALLAVKTQLLRYYTACMQARNKSERNAENCIDRKLLHTVENLINDDMTRGGSHDMKYIQGARGHSILNVNSMVFAGFDTINVAKNVLYKIGCPIDGTYNISDEADRIGKMIDDLGSMSTRDFAKKYFTMNYVDELMDSLAGSVAMQNFEMNENSFFTDPNKLFCAGVYFYGKDLMRLPQFINANPAVFGKGAASIAGGIPYINEEPIERLLVRFTAEHERIKNLRLLEIKLCIFPRGNGNSFYEIDAAIPGSDLFLKALRSKLFPRYLSMRIKYNSTDKEGQEQERLEFEESVKKILAIEDMQNVLPDLGQPEGADKRVYDLKKLLKGEQKRFHGKFKVTGGGLREKNAIIYQNKKGRLKVIINTKEPSESFYFRAKPGNFTSSDYFGRNSYTGMNLHTTHMDAQVPEEFMDITNDYLSLKNGLTGIERC